jgi:hypothetical protein
MRTTNVTHVLCVIMSVSEVKKEPVTHCLQFAYVELFGSLKMVGH